jgi:hypothetical protein
VDAEGREVTVSWVAILSWHIVRSDTAANQYRTRCGRTATGETFDVRPAGKTCETCLRLTVDADTFRAVTDPEGRIAL